MVLWSLSSLPERPSDNHKEMPSSSDLCSFHLIYSSASKPTPTTLTSAQNPTQSAGIHLVSCSMSKPIVQLRELFQYIAGSQWTSHLSAFTTELFPSPPVHAVSSPAPTYSVPAGQGASQLVFSCLALLAPSGRPVAYTSQPGSQWPSVGWNAD